jgi:hypothetical protein
MCLKTHTSNSFKCISLINYKENKMSVTTILAFRLIYAQIDTDTDIDIFLVVLGFELRASHLLGRCATRILNILDKHCLTELHPCPSYTTGLVVMNSLSISGKVFISPSLLNQFHQIQDSWLNLFCSTLTVMALCLQLFMFLLRNLQIILPRSPCM